MNNLFVLIADNEPFALIKASNGKEVLNIINEEEQNKRYFDFIMLDYNMPDLVGIEASKKIPEMIKTKLIDSFYIALTTKYSNS